MNRPEILVKVTPDDIAAGIPKTSYCPVALALDRDARMPWRWHVTAPDSEDRCFAWFAPEGLAPTSRMPLPSSVARFVRRFDAGETVEPFSFEIDR